MRVGSPKSSILGALFHLWDVLFALPIHKIKSETDLCSTDSTEKVVYKKVELNLMLCEQCYAFSNSQRIGQCLEIL